MTGYAHSRFVNCYTGNSSGKIFILQPGAIGRNHHKNNDKKS